MCAYYANLCIFVNKVANYRKILKQVTKLDLKTKIKDLTDEQFLLLCQAVQRVEGFQIGEITVEISRKKILDVKKNKQNLIIQYLIEGYGWLRKAEAINLVEKDVVDAVIVKRQNGYIFLRSRPDLTKANNLDK